jgi:hypothetical protein
MGRSLELGAWSYEGVERTRRISALSILLTSWESASKVFQSSDPRYP